MKLGYFEKGFIQEDQLQYAVIGAVHEGKWLFVRHKERETWEIPGGHREEGEPIDHAAKRELMEETGATAFDLVGVVDYTVTTNSATSYGRLYYANVQTLDPLNPAYEIAEIIHQDQMPENLTYPDIQPHLHKILDKFRNEL